MNDRVEMVHSSTKKRRYIGKTTVSFENGELYECDGPRADSLSGAWYDIKDESGEWYMYQEQFVKDNFDMA